MNDTFLKQARHISDELCALRHELHMWPELGNQEFRTAERIERCLNAWDIPCRRVLGTAVIGRLDGALPGPTAAFRADMDALPLCEATGAAYASRNPGVMHACGHDVHVVAALGAARLLAAHRDRLRGAVVFLFQPDEEGRGGAQRMIEAGALEGVDAVFGAHVSPDIPEGCVGVRYGKFYAASDTFRVTIRGVSAHGAQRERGVDALGAAAELVGRLIGLPELLSGERTVLTVGTMHAGTAENALADRAEFAGMMRSLGPKARGMLRERFRETVGRVTTAWGASAEVELRESYPGVVNDDEMTGLAQRAATALLGKESVFTIDGPTMTTEDFGYFLLKRPGCFYHIGAGCALPLHSTGFLPTDAALVTAAAVHAAVLDTFLHN